MVVVLYLLKRKRVVKLVSSTLLWQKFLADTQANAPFQKLRHHWLLILQLLLLLLAILALSRPYFAGHSATSGLRVVILDASASMQSTDEDPSRFEKARAEALAMVDGLKDQEEMLVLLASANTEVKQSATANKAALRRALENCQVTDSSTRLTEALKLAGTLIRDKRDPEIHLFSDGAAGDLSEFENKGLRVVYHKLGRRSENLGITTLDIRENPENHHERAIYTSVANFSTNARQTVLELLFDKEVVDTRPLTLQPGETSPQVFTAVQERDGIFTVRIDAKDDLAADNQASIVSLLPQPIKVLLVSRGNRFLEKALRAANNVNLTLAHDTLDGAENYDIVILDDVVPTVWPKPNLLAVHIATTNWFDSGWTNIEAPSAVDWKNTHPLLRYINLDNVQIGETLAVKTPSWAVALVDAPQHAPDSGRRTGAAENCLDRLRHPAKHLAVAHFFSDVHGQRRRVAQPGRGQIQPASAARGGAVSPHSGPARRHGGSDHARWQQENHHAGGRARNRFWRHGQTRDLPIAGRNE